MNSQNIEEEKLKKEILDLEKKLRDREKALPAHSTQPQQILLIDELEMSIKERKNKLAELKDRKSGS